MAIATLTLHAIATIIPCPRSKEGYIQQHFTKNRLHKFNRQHKPKARAVFHNTARAIFRFRDTYFFSCWGVRVLSCRGVKMSAAEKGNYSSPHPYNLTTSSRLWPYRRLRRCRLCLFNNIKRAILVHAHPNHFGLTVRLGLPLDGQLIVTFRACALGFSRE